MALGSTQPLTEMSTPGAFPGGKSGRRLRLTVLPPSCAVVMKCGKLNFLEPSGPLQACNGTALPLLRLSIGSAHSGPTASAVRTSNNFGHTHLSTFRYHSMQNHIPGDRNFQGHCRGKKISHGTHVRCRNFDARQPFSTT